MREEGHLNGLTVASALSEGLIFRSRELWVVPGGLVSLMLALWDPLDCLPHHIPPLLPSLRRCSFDRRGN